MNSRYLPKVISLWILLVLAAVPLLGQSQQKPLDDKDNPLLIGKRDINKGQIEFYSLDKEIALGRQLAAEVDRETKFVTDPLITEYVNRVGQNLVLHSDAKVPFTIKVVDDTVINAFALPGGHLYINRGILEAADNEAEMAGVIAHEIAHVAARHGVEQASKGQLINYASLPLIFLGGVGGFAIQQAAGLAIPLTFLKFSRGAEEEADRLGAQYLWASGYDPQAMLSFFEKLEGKEKKKPGTISKVFSTHPMTGDRIKLVNQLVVRFPNKEEYEISSSEFSKVKARLVSISAAKPGDTQANRPTLKRRPAQKGDEKGTDETATDQQPPERPTLKRSDGSKPESEPSKPESESKP
jgi:predicted Zn-dependent protease